MTQTYLIKHRPDILVLSAIIVGAIGLSALISTFDVSAKLQSGINNYPLPFAFGLLCPALNFQTQQCVYQNGVTTLPWWIAQDVLITTTAIMFLVAIFLVLKARPVKVKVIR